MSEHFKNLVAIILALFTVFVIAGTVALNYR